MTFNHLLAPGRLGGIELRNRIVLPGMDTNHCDDGVVTQAEIDHYAARSAGGCGLVITGASAISYPLGATSRHQAALSDDRYLPGLTALTDAIHAGGAKFCAQLVHHGKTSGVDTAEGRPLLVPSVPTDKMDLSALADSPIDELMKMATATQGKSPTYKVADAVDIAWVVDQFAQAADRVKRAGADAVEVHGAHGYLISTFLSRAYNTRDDEYGGPLENRARILVEVLGAVRNAVGPDFPILVRLNGCEFGIEHGITIEETVATARIAEAAGADAIHVSANAANPFRDFTKGPLPDTVAAYRPMAAAVKAAVSIPVLAVGRLLPEIGEEMLANGECDFVSMGRQQLADPNLAEKLARGRRASIRPCVNCYVCVEQNFFDASAICAVNVALGNESQAAVPTAPAAPARHVLVVGGGPGGLEAARIAATRGHRVTLLERSDALGGSTWFAARTGSPNQWLVDWLVHEVGDAGVDVRLGCAADVHVVRSLAPDVVVVATGALGMPCPTDVPVDGAPATDISVVGGDLIGLSIAQHLAGQGHAVTVHEPGKHLGSAMALPRRWTAVFAAGGAGVRLVRESAGPDESTGRVIVTNAQQPNTELADELRRAGFEVHVVGDANGLGYLQGAMHSAHAVASAL